MKRSIRAVTIVEIMVMSVVLTLCVGLIFGGIGGCLSMVQSEPGSSPWAQQWARRFGGSYTLNAKQDQRLLTVVWHGDELWLLTRPMEQGEYPRTYHLEEKSKWGIIQGVVTINETSSKAQIRPETPGR